MLLLYNLQIILIKSLGKRAIRDFEERPRKECGWFAKIKWGAEQQNCHIDKEFGNS